VNNFKGKTIYFITGASGVGKTTLIAGLGLYGLRFAEDAMIPVAASTRDQAKIMYRQAKGFLRRSQLNDPGFEFEAFDGYRYKGSRMLLPAWSVTPVFNGTSWHAWVKESHAHWDDMKWPRWYGRFGVNEYDDSFHGGGCLTECVCGINDMFAAFIRDVDVVDLGAGVKTDRQMWEDTCDYAWDRWRKGWKMCFDAAAFTGDEPSTALGYQYSPFWRTDAMKSLSAPELHTFVNRQPSYELVNMIPRARYAEEPTQPPAA